MNEISVAASMHSPRKARGHGKPITHRSVIVATVLLCSTFTILNVHIGRKSLTMLRRQQMNSREPTYDEPHTQRKHRRKASLSTPSSNHKLRKEIPIIEHGSIHDGKHITQVLRAEIELQKSNQLHRYKFLPGTLEMTSTESLQHCHVNTNQYEHHFPTRGPILVSLSESHKLIYRNIPKSASSSSRHAMKEWFDGEDMRIKVEDLKSRVENDAYQLVSFIRDPLDRFYSSYDEAFFRKGPWFGEGRLVKNRPGEVKGYLKNKHKLDPYPYLYDGLRTYDDYRDKFCDKGNDIDCKMADTIDDGDLTRRFEQFVADYDGRDPFDVHLSLQVPFLTIFGTGEPLPISMLYNASTADTDWLYISRQHEVDVPDDGLVHGRKSPRRFDISLVRDVTNRKICEILMLDYCCLNLELPNVCKQAMNEEGNIDALSCAMATQNSIRYISPWNNL
jgi:hypothetical protein